MSRNLSSSWKNIIKMKVLMTEKLIFIKMYLTEPLRNKVCYKCLDKSTRKEEKDKLCESKVR